MPPVLLDKPLYIVDAGPFPGCYRSYEAYQHHCESQGVSLQAYFEKIAKHQMNHAQEDPLLDLGGEG